MRRHIRCLALLASGAGGSLAACGAGDDNAAQVAVPDARAKPDASIPDASEGGSVASTDGATTVVNAVAYVRLAQWSADGPPIDYCLAPHGSGTFHGPLLSAAFGAAPDGGTLGVPFPSASAYMQAPTGTFDVRIVAAGALDCTAPLGPDAVGADAGVLLAANSYSTVAALGFRSAQSTGGLRAATFADDRVPPQGDVALRLINAEPAVLSASVGTANDGLVFPSVPYGSDPNAGSNPNADKNGYAPLGPLSGDTLQVFGTDLDGAVTLAANAALSAASPAVMTWVLLPSPVATSDAGDAASPTYAPHLLECIDNAGVAQGVVLSNCMGPQ